MTSANPIETLNCSQCGGELHPDEGQIFLVCPYCGSTVYIDRSRVVFHWSLTPTLDQEQARAELMRWMAGNQTVKDLDRKATLTGESFEYFPVWYLKQKQKDSRERILLQSAAATSTTEIEKLNLPAGDLQKYSSSLDSQARLPTVPLEAAYTWLAQEGVPRDEIVEQSLVHIPVYTFKYNFKGNPYTAIVEGATGVVFANIYPAKSEAPYRTIGLVTALIFLCLAVIPLFMAASRGLAGTGFGLVICFGIGIVFVPILFAIAATIAAKV